MVYGVPKEKHLAVMVRGWVMTALLLIGIYWILTRGLDTGNLLPIALIYGSIGLFIGREMYFGTFRREFFGVSEGKLDGWFDAAIFVLSGWTLWRLGVSLWSREWAEAAAKFVFWWTGVALATVFAVRDRWGLNASSPRVSREGMTHIGHELENWPSAASVLRVGS